MCIISFFDNQNLEAYYKSLHNFKQTRKSIPSFKTPWKMFKLQSLGWTQKIKRLMKPILNGGDEKCITTL